MYLKLGCLGTKTELTRKSSDFQNILCCSFIARDDVNVTSAMLKLNVLICPDCVHGTCDYEDLTTITDITMFAIATCDCDTGYDGKLIACLINI